MYIYIYIRVCLEQGRSEEAWTITHTPAHTPSPPVIPALRSLSVLNVHRSSRRPAPSLFYFLFIFFLFFIFFFFILRVVERCRGRWWRYVG